MSKISQKRGVLFINHLATRNGAPMMLMHFLHWLRQHSQRPFSILIDDRTNGTLLPEYRKIADTWCAKDGRWGADRVRSGVMLAIGMYRVARRIDRWDLRRFAARCKPALIYSNSFGESNFQLTELLELGLPILSHVHEMGFLFRQRGGSRMHRMLSGTERFIACSNAVKENLISHSVSPDRIETVHEFIPVANIQAQRSRAEVLRELGFPASAFLVAGCGSGQWNKGMDVFLQLARVVCGEHNNIHFVWVGDGIPSARQLQHDADMLGLANNVRFTGKVEQSADYLAAAEIFALTSREDSFPLACLEAAALGKPIVCFANAGGMPEFVETDCGFVVPYLDVSAMADRIVRLANCPACSAKMAAAARSKVALRHDISVAAPRILEIIERTIQDASR